MKSVSKLFDAVRELVLAQGGDGDGWIISSRYKELAQLFEEHEKQYNWFVSRDDYANYISFSNSQESQESIVFSASREILPEFGGDIVVEVKYV